MEIYKDFELNKIANEVQNEFNELKQALNAMLSHSNNFQLENKVKQIKENPIAFADLFFIKIYNKLSKIERKLGSNDEIYKKFCDGLAYAIIELINFPITNAHGLTYAGDYKKHLNDPEIINIKNSLTKTVPILNKLNQLKLSSNVKNEVINLLNTVKVLEKKLDPSGGCYIATYVYEDYNSPEVIRFRIFRDTYLSNSYLGVLFIKFYYNISPKLIKLFSNNKYFKIINKYILDFILRFIKK
jgi:hypothetical protein